jgi:hypothetical protein
MSFVIVDVELSFDPNVKPKYGRRSTHPSIWWRPDRQRRYLVSALQNYFFLVTDDKAR